MEGKDFSIGNAFSYGWASIKKDFWYFVGLAATIMVITSIPSWIDNQSTILGLVSLALSAWLAAGTMRILIDYYGGNQREFGDVFRQTKYFWRVLGASIFLGIIILLGTILLIIPGIYLALRYMFTVYYIVDQDVTIGEAMNRSRQLTDGVKWQLFVFSIACVGVFILGALALVVGILVAVPVIWLATVYVYRQLQPTTATTSTQPTNSPVTGQ